MIGQHHEHIDGTGYPKQLVGERISALARIVAIVNEYDNLCNQHDPADSLTPYEALSQIFAQKRSQFDHVPLTQFIRCMGIYPPGTVVRLSDDTLGMVVSVNAAKPLLLWVLIYDPAVPKEQALILDLRHEPDLQVVASLRPAELASEVHTYPSPCKRMTYHFDAQNKLAPRPQP